MRLNFCRPLLFETFNMATGVPAACLLKHHRVTVGASASPHAAWQLADCHPSQECRPVIKKEGMPARKNVWPGEGALSADAAARIAARRPQRRRPQASPRLLAASMQAHAHGSAPATSLLQPHAAPKRYQDLASGPLQRSYRFRRAPSWILDHVAHA